MKQQQQQQQQQSQQQQQETGGLELDQDGLGMRSCCTNTPQPTANMDPHLDNCPFPLKHTSSLERMHVHIHMYFKEQIICL